MDLLQGNVWAVLQQDPRKPPHSVEALQSFDALLLLESLLLLDMSLIAFVSLIWQDVQLIPAAAILNANALT